MTKVSTTVTTSDGGICLYVQADRDDGRLALEYTLENETAAGIYLVNRPFRWLPEGLTSTPDIVYTEMLDGSLHLTKACLEVPYGLKVEDPDVPYLTHVPAKGKMSERLQLSLPVEPFHPYDQVAFSERVNEFEPVTFRLGWFAEDAVSVRSHTWPDGTTRLSADYGEVLDSQSIISAVLSIGIPAFISKEG